ncbi:MAG: glycosyltransferase family 39 protein [Planctomycetota bacterium]
MNLKTNRPPLFWVWLGALLAAFVAWWARPLLLIDETRYLSVAWEMWRTSEFLVPHINGETYAHKPPLLFWFMHAGWSVFGVQLWWPRLLGFLFLTSAALLLKHLVDLLLPLVKQENAGTFAAIIFLGTLSIFAFSTMVMFDLLLLNCILLTWLALINTHLGGSVVRGALLFGFGIGLGILAKGPVVLLFALPPAFAAAHWAANARNIAWVTFLGVLLGAGVALAWAIPAGIAGGEEYRDAIFWGQTAGRVTDSFAHARPWHWYLPLLPAMLLPWVLLPNFWTWVRKNPAPNKDQSSREQRFLLWASIPAFLILCFLSGKQPHYLVPVIAAISALFGIQLAKGLSKSNGRIKGISIGPSVLFLLTGICLLILPQVGDSNPRLAWLSQDWSIVPGGLMLLAAGLWLLAAKRQRHHILQLGLFCPLWISLLHLGLRGPLQGNYNLAPLSQKIAQWQDAGQDVAFSGAMYHGQFSFLGRLEDPLANPTTLRQMLDWAKDNPTEPILIVLDKHSRKVFSSKATSLLAYGTKQIAVWETASDFQKAIREDSKASD